MTKSPTYIIATDLRNLLYKQEVEVTAKEIAEKLLFLRSRKDKFWDFRAVTNSKEPMLRLQRYESCDR
jgi:hypothetical protein